MRLEKPKCECGKEMQVIYYSGYYESFKYWEFHKDCMCLNSAEIEDFDIDHEWSGSN